MRSHLELFCGNPVEYVETIDVKAGVMCDIYKFTDDPSSDLAIVSVKSSQKTPTQRVLGGEKTVEGYIAGEGVLRVVREDGTRQEYAFPGAKENVVNVAVGDVMQWESVKDLVFSEQCTPPYVDGRFENIDEEKI